MQSPFGRPVLSISPPALDGAATRVTAGPSRVAAVPRPALRAELRAALIPPWQPPHAPASILTSSCFHARRGRSGECVLRVKGGSPPAGVIN